MELLKDLELIDVQYSNDNKKATLIFLDESRGEIREVIFNKQIYENGAFEDSEEKANKVERWCNDLFYLSFNELEQAIGLKKDVYAYDKFNSLFEVSVVNKFDDDMVGQIFEAVVTEVVDDSIAIRIRFEYDGKLYESKMNYADYVDSRKEWYVNPQKQLKQYLKFLDKFHIDIDSKQQLVGKTVMVEIKKAMGKYTYADIKPFPKVKKK